ncbi:hypothetical protein HanIR_Chr15g0778081 [Helianthus annuus]|nr:hypothetical protein HanIR_Chr15g0778081 [Helianthus annuus]
MMSDDDDEGRLIVVAAGKTRWWWWFCFYFFPFLSQLFKTLMLLFWFGSSLGEAHENKVSVRVVRDSSQISFGFRFRFRVLVRVRVKHGQGQPNMVKGSCDLTQSIPGQRGASGQFWIYGQHGSNPVNSGPGNV